MSLDRRFRVVAAIVVLVALVLFAGTLLAVADTVLSVLERLRQGPALIYYGFLALLAAGTAGAVWLLWWLLWPRGRKTPEKKSREPVTEGDLADALEAERALGTDTAAAERELAELARRRSTGALYIALFGEASAGKSSLVKALVPGAAPEIDVRSGTTRTVTHYRWELDSGDVLEVADVPGSGDDAALDELAMDEALRAHVVVYVCDGDLTRSQYEDLAALATAGKPMVVALNKSDRYSPEELPEVARRVEERLSGLEPGPEVVPVTAGGMETVVVRGPDGQETRTQRPRPAKADELRQALQRQVDSSTEALDALRDASVFRRASEKLADAAAARQRERADEIVAGYTKKAIIGALAAVSPGADILIQGYLGTALVRELCKLYGAPVRDLDVQKFLDIAQGYVGRAVPLLLAISGNVLKAFPGAGTVAGGLAHAVAYGLIFDALGKGLVHSLETTGELRPAAAARKVGDELGDDIGRKARRLARLALEARRDTRGRGGS
ncbi:MAG: 50S ribosome-binding GTPase [Gammaproteobacteria bacterium]